MRFTRIIAGCLALVGMATATAVAQSPMPWAEFRSTVVKAITSEPRASTPPLTSDSLADAAEVSLARFATARDSIAAIVPEECYAAGQDEMVAFIDDLSASLRDGIPLMRSAGSGMGAVGVYLAAILAIREAHPDAYVADEQSLGGYRLEPMRILDVLQTCEPTASASPSASASPEASAGPEPTSVVAASSPGTVSFEGSGSGSKSTAPIELAAGDHVLTYRATAVDQLCSFGVALASTDGAYRQDVATAGLYIYQGSPLDSTSSFFAPVAGRFYLDVSGDCDWEMSLASGVSLGDDSSPIVIEGTGAQGSPSFRLAGGDYRVTYTLTSPASDDTCTVYADGIVDPEHTSNVIGGDIQVDMPPSTTRSDETWAYAVPAGTYVYRVYLAWCQFPASERVDWSVTIEQP